jgi:hypothetical protein
VSASGRFPRQPFLLTMNVHRECHTVHPAFVVTYWLPLVETARRKDAHNNAVGLDKHDSMLDEMSSIHALMYQKGAHEKRYAEKRHNYHN